MPKFIDETFSGCNPACHDDNIMSGASEHADRAVPRAKPTWIMPPLKAHEDYQMHLAQELPPWPPPGQMTARGGFKFGGSATLTSA